MPPFPDTTLGLRVRAARLQVGMSQGDLARRIGMTQANLCMIEQGDTQNPGAGRIRAIAQVLHVSADYLLGLSDE